MEYMHSTAVPPPEVTTEYKAVPAGYVLFCYALLIEDTPLLVDGLTMEWSDQYGSSLKESSGTSIAVHSDGRRRVGIDHKPQMTSDGGVYTCQVSLSSENMFIALQQPTVQNVIHTVTVTSKYVNPCVHMCSCMCARLCMCVFECVCVCLCVYVCACVHVCMCACVHVCMCVCLCVYVCLCVHVCMCVCMCIIFVMCVYMCVCVSIS